MAPASNDIKKEPPTNQCPSMAPSTVGAPSTGISLAKLHLCRAQFELNSVSPGISRLPTVNCISNHHRTPEKCLKNLRRTLQHDEPIFLPVFYRILQVLSPLIPALLPRSNVGEGSQNQVRIFSSITIRLYANSHRFVRPLTMHVLAS